MAKKIIDNFIYIGLAALVGGYIYYSSSSQWDWKAQAAVYGGAALVLVYLIFNFRSIRGMTSGRTGRYGTVALTVAVIVVGILILVNFLSFRHHKRVDLSSEQIFGLSDQSEKIVQNLKSDIQVIGFYQDDRGAEGFRNLMREYRYASARVKSEVVDPQKDPGKVAEFKIERNGQIVVASGPKRETIDEAREEKITNAIIKVTRDTQKTVYFLKGHGERDINDTGPKGYSQAKEAIASQNYQVKDYNLAQENKIPEDATVIVSAGPTTDFFPNETALLEQFVEQGGKLLILADPENEFKMDEFLSVYGLGLSGKVVIDASGIGQLMGLGPSAPLVGEYTDHAITRDFNVMTFYPMAQNVKTVTSSAGFQTTGLMSTSRDSWAETKLTSEVQFNEGLDEQGPLNLAAVATKSLTPPQPPAAPGSPEEPKPPAKEARVVLFGDSDFASNSFSRRRSNLDLFLNSVSWLAEDADLIAIRPKDPENRSVNLTFQQSSLLFWGTVVLLPLATLITGIGVWYRRR